MKNVRIISRLDIKNNYLIKGIQLEGLRKLGDPHMFAKRYYEQGIDEMILMDIVASLYNRNSLHDIVKQITKDVFIPITVGGGIRSLEDAQIMLRAGADKIAVNTAAIKNNALITDISRSFGSQCMVLSIEAKKKYDHKWEAYYDNGREKTGMDVVEWAKRGAELGAGEILLTSVDCEGTEKGFDCELIEAVSSAVPVPVIASGGFGKIEDFDHAVIKGHADAVAIASMLHYNKLPLNEIKDHAVKTGFNLRRK